MKRQNKTNRVSFLEKHFTLFIVAILVILGFSIYSNTFQASFHFDDYFYIQNNKVVKNLHEFLNMKYWRNIYYRPVSTFTFAVNYRLHEFDVFGYHLVNILIHILSAVVTYFLSSIILRKTIYNSDNEIQKCKIISAFVALLFLSHPIQTQSVDYIVQRMTLMAGLFYMLSILVYLKARFAYYSGKRNKSIIFYILTLLIFYLASYSKQNAATIPLAILLVEILFVRNKLGKISKINVIVLSLSISIIALIVLLGGLLPQEAKSISREQYLGTQFRVIFKYIQLLLLPVNQNFDPFVEISTHLFGIKEILTFIGHLVILGIGVFFYKKNKIITFGIFWFYITLLIESSIIPIRDVMFEHRLYLPSYGFYLIFIVVLFNYLNKKMGIAITSLILICMILIYSGMSYQRNKVWQNEYTLWYDVTTKTPVKSRPYRYVGVELIKMGKYDDAMIALDKALELDPTRWEEHKNKAVIYNIRKDYRSAINELSICIKIDPENDQFFLERANNFMKLGNMEAGKNDLEKALSIAPYNYSAYYSLGAYYLKNGEYIKAIENFDNAILLNKNYIEALNDKGVAQMKLNLYKEALDNFDQILSVDISNVSAYMNRGQTLFYLEKYREAINDYTSLIRLNLKDASSYKNRAVCYVKLKEYQLALNDLKSAQYYGENISPNLIKELEKIIEDQ